MALEDSPNWRRGVDDEDVERGVKGGDEAAEITSNADSMRWMTAHAMTLRWGVRTRKSLQSASWDDVRDVAESSVSIVARTSVIWMQRKQRTARRAVSFP